MTTLKLTDNEVRALSGLLVYATEACSSGCVFPEMQKSKKGCEKCNYLLAIASIEAKLGVHD